MIGIFDSGVGGLYIYQLLKERLPNHEFLYLADHAFAPYGYKTTEEITARTHQLARFFEARGAELVVIACNTATVNSIDQLRASFPEIEFVGIEPAIKPAAANHAKIIVLGTHSTVSNSRYRNLVKEVAGNREVWHIGATELVMQVEEGDLVSSDLLQEKLAVAINQGAEALVVGCTHFSFLVPVIRRTWPDLTIYDGSFGVVGRVCGLVSQGSGGGNGDQLLTTGPDREVSFTEEMSKVSHIDLALPVATR